VTAFGLAAVVGGMFAVGTFLLLRRDLVRVVWGVTVLSQAANVYLLTMGGVVLGTGSTVPVLAHHGGETPQTTDPVVQALVLTAIVISFGMTAFALVLSLRVYEENGSLDLSKLEGDA
jgi:multicomponent Na+:H+ antiporter subunit C